MLAVVLLSLHFVNDVKVSSCFQFALEFSKFFKPPQLLTGVGFLQRLPGEQCGTDEPHLAEEIGSVHIVPLALENVFGKTPLSDPPTDCDEGKLTGPNR